MEQHRVLIPIIEAPTRQCELRPGCCGTPKFLLDMPGCPDLTFCCSDCAEDQRRDHGAEVQPQLRAA